MGKGCLPLAAILALVSLCPAGQWLAADLPGGRAPFDPVPLFWFRVVRCPAVYRRVIVPPVGARRATALLRSSGYVYVYLDGKQVYAWEPAKDSAERARIPGEPDRIHEIDIDFAEHRDSSKHVLAVSAPPGRDGTGGVVLDGGLYGRTHRLEPLLTDFRWTVTVFRPTESIEDHPIMTLGYDGKAQEGVCTAAMEVKRVGLPFQADENALAAAHFRARRRRLRRRLDDALWRLELLEKKGIYIADGAPCGWGGPERPQIVEALRSARRLFKSDRAAARKALDALGKLDVRTSKELGTYEDRIDRAAGLVSVLQQEAAYASGCADSEDEGVALERAWRALPEVDISKTSHVPEVLRQFGLAAGHPLGRLNESRHDRLGWLPHPHLTDSDPGTWGLRVNPVTGPSAVRFGRRWRFRTDPGNVGVQELRHTIGYNIEGQWPTVDGHGGWTRSKAFAGYEGIAWYRGRAVVPAEWAGQEVTLTLPVAGEARVWLNDREITALRKDRRGTYVVPARRVAFGTENVLAVRVKAAGAKRGLLSGAELSCPALTGPAGKNTPTVGILATPLSPCVVLAPRAESLHIHHAGRAELIRPGGAGKAAYRAEAEGKLQANWVLLWLAPSSATAAERPILLAFEKNPLSVVCEDGGTRLRVVKGSRVIAVRPWAKALPKRDDPAVKAKAAFWSRAALAVPINYMTVTRVLKKGEPWRNATINRVPAGPVLGQTVLYDYLETEDAWGTEPLQIAPVPALCSFAMDCAYRGLKVDDAAKVQTLQDGGMAAPYRAIVGADRLGYRYPVEPFPRLVGFTSWMFAGSDTGVAGNAREVELIAATGANSYRPQNNFCTERSPHFRDDRRTRIQILADFCRGAGLNFTNNIDQTLGAKREEVRADYDGWVKGRLFPHYDQLVPQLADRAFWQVAYDLINEPFDHQAPAYNRTMKALTARIRRLDPRHLFYLEPCQAWGAIQQLRLIEPTGDPLTVYSFHDYNFRMKKAEDRWPTLDRDITDICRMWWPAFEFAIRHGVAMHCGEYGGFHPPTDDKLCQTTLLNDFLRLFDQFGMHHHYYTGRGIYRRQLDGSLRPSNVVRTFRKYAARPDLNCFYELWKGHPKPRGR